MSAREHLKRLADEFFADAMMKHAEGAALARASARLEQASAMLSDEQAADYLQAFLGASLAPDPVQSTDDSQNENKN